MTDMTKKTKKDKIGQKRTDMTEKFLSANNLSTSRTAERHARGQKLISQKN